MRGALLACLTMLILSGCISGSTDADVVETVPKEVGGSYNETFLFQNLTGDLALHILVEYDAPCEFALRMSGTYMDAGTSALLGVDFDGLGPHTSASAGDRVSIVDQSQTPAAKDGHWTNAIGFGALEPGNLGLFAFGRGLESRDDKPAMSFSAQCEGNLTFTRILTNTEFTLQGLADLATVGGATAGGASAGGGVITDNIEGTGIVRVAVPRTQAVVGEVSLDLTSPSGNTQWQGNLGEPALFQFEDGPGEYELRVAGGQTQGSEPKVALMDGMPVASLTHLA